ncbi:MAG: flagellar export chaperone FliS [Succinivibrio sp.]|nr:flagellar export chaperone FliS [Succinivibrio sp.]MCI5577049.1 flagellar export chaperone FliS [Succinivibrio sp.]MCI5637969.1 flagellar export chaperone FliS [Succinivibrio sp.]MCI6450113.1 flagellar export chaperone FliS [Succinivibrio sp.]MCI7773878.1 flagellar export chaperone FliS [Succinivibrio sp.]
MYGRNLKAYKKTNLEAELSVADPHRVIQMMYEGLIERLSQAKGAIMRHDYEYKADRISKAVGIINGLQSALDNRSNPELGQRMFALYDYMKELLTKASVSLDTAPIDEVINLILPIKQAWDQIPQDIKEKTNQQILNSPDY